MSASPSPDPSGRAIIKQEKCEGRQLSGSIKKQKASKSDLSLRYDDRNRERAVKIVLHAEAGFGISFIYRCYEFIGKIFFAEVG